MNNLTLHIGDRIHYGGHGVCLVCGRETKKLGSSSRDYYLLRPVSNDRITLYLPVDAQPEQVHLRQVLSAQEIYTLVDQEQDNPPGWITDSRVRRQVCGQTLRSGDPGALIRLVKDLYLHAQQMPPGRILPMRDQEALSSAQQQLYDEFQYVLNIGQEQLLPFLLGQCQVTAK